MQVPEPELVTLTEYVELAYNPASASANADSEEDAVPPVQTPVFAPVVLVRDKSVRPSKKDLALLAAYLGVPIDNAIYGKTHMGQINNVINQRLQMIFEGRIELKFKPEPEVFDIGDNASAVSTSLSQSFSYDDDTALNKKVNKLFEKLKSMTASSSSSSSS